MTAAFSVWLDLCRVLAAGVVFLGHARGLGLAPEWLAAHWHRTAEDAVIAFFLISGYVVPWSTDRANTRLRGYIEARASRIYSVAIPAVLLALALDNVGMRLDASRYDVDWQYQRLWLYLPLHWLFLGGTWIGPIDPFSMRSYWSLPYEVWYYALFGCATLLRGRSRIAGVALVLAIMGPRLWLLLPCWWLGVLLYRHRERLAVSKRIAPVLMLGACALYIAFVVLDGRAALDTASRVFYAWINGWSPWPFVPGGTVHALTDYAVAGLVALFLIGCSGSAHRFPTAAVALIRGLAAYSFSFYLIHFSVLVLFGAVGWSAPGTGQFVVIVLTTLIVTWLLGQVGEARRSIYRRAIARLLDAFDTLRPQRVPASQRK